MADRPRLEGVRQDTVTGSYGLAGNDPLRDQLAERGKQVGARTAEIDAEIPRRVAALTELGTVWGEFVYERDRGAREQRATRRAERALNRVDRELGRTPPAARPDEATDLGARSRAVLEAYRELLGLL